MDKSFWILWIFLGLGVFIGIGVSVYFFCFKDKPTKSMCFRKDQFNKRHPIVLLIGTPGVGKTTFAKQIGNKGQQYLVSPLAPQFGHVHLDELGITIADTPALQMDDEIDKREETIKLFQQYFQLCQDRISLIALVVNFERTDLMKKKLSDAYKYFNNFNRNKIIIITSWEFSENKIEDEQALRTKFAIFKAQEIYFISNSSADIQSQFKNLNLSIPSEPLRTKDTIFEVINEQDTNDIKNKLNAISNQVNRNQTCNQTLSLFTKDQNNDLKEVLVSA